MDVCVHHHLSLTDLYFFVFVFAFSDKVRFTLQILLPVLIKACFSFDGVTGKRKFNFVQLEFQFMTHLGQ